MYSPCFTCWNRYGKEYSKECDETCELAKIEKEKREFEEEIEFVKDELDRPINSLYDVAVLLCLATSFASDNCNNCPVVLYDYDKRTKYEKCCLHEPCQINLYKWLVDQAKGEK